MNNNKHLNLNQVTLIIVDCINPEMAVEALNFSSQNIKFAERILFCDEKPFNYDSSITYIEINKLDIVGYNKFMLHELYKYIKTDFCLVIQTDGFITDYTKWDDNFLNYDYIGAPWIRGAPFANPNMRVGNGGFSLRSKKLLSNTVSFKSIANEDVVISVINRPHLEKNGIKFAPLDVAKYFSYEMVCDDLNVNPRDCFGYHGKHYTNFHIENTKKLYFEFFKNSIIKMPYEKLVSFFMKNNFLNLQKIQNFYAYADFLNFLRSHNIKNYLEISSNDDDKIFINSIFLQKSCEKIHYIYNNEYNEKVEKNISSKFKKINELFQNIEFYFYGNGIKDLHTTYDCVCIDVNQQHENIIFFYEKIKYNISMNGYIIFYNIPIDNDISLNAWNFLLKEHKIINIESNMYKKSDFKILSI